MRPTAVLPEESTWQVHLDRTMWVAGVRSLMLQALHPRAMQGVWQRSDFLDDPTGRLLRTADFVSTTTYGHSVEAHELGRRIQLVHNQLTFTDPATATRHRPDEPELLVWVHCAEVASYLEVVTRAGLRLRRREADDYLAEQARTAAYVGVDPADVPSSVAQLRAYLARTRPQLRTSPEAVATVRYLLWPEMPERLRLLAPLKPLWFLVGALAYHTLPRWARRAYNVLPEPPGSQVATTAALGALRTGLHALPTDLYDRLFAEETRERARAARVRLHAAGYDVSHGLLGLREPARWPTG
ncbi:uncharacterized protein (DUF2236 family) [Haloactinospora alba]|uniref:Uncharacterized protein (DUF2236 family) n=1 Tax=Haloactinospora alba TaxID=405555 RepID=A0A543NIT5_9ACTN|nr:oxygenase MpaB family protein [Haloactinospora alba]TQN31761.1 uncharacterized protein (DUF2236 family) [Haloactinospora alba]